jgi:hypothetical protein
MNTTEADTTVIIPTYWTWSSSDSRRPEVASYDHPTPLDAESTLPPLLDDLSNQQTSGFRVLILAGTTHPDLGGSVADRLRNLLEPYRERLHLHMGHAAGWERLKALLQLTEPQAEMLHLGSYSGVRNLQLLLPHILGSEVVIALDDDERVRPTYIEDALRHVGKTVNGQRALGLAGPYLQRDGGVFLHEPPPTGNVFRDKAHSINEAMRVLTASKGRLTQSPMALGGNMVFHRDLFTRVCFDPGITRGEDIDYLINTRLQGISWWFDANLTILHLPPRHRETPAYQRTREDVFRFIYEREKLRLNGENRPAWLEPYPGVLLGDDLIGQASAALELDATPEMTERFGGPQSIVQQAQAHAARNASRYSSFVMAWKELMSRIDHDANLRENLAAAIPQL